MWIVLEEAHCGKIKKEDIRKTVSTEMNPQVVCVFGLKGSQN